MINQLLFFLWYPILAAQWSLGVITLRGTGATTSGPYFDLIQLSYRTAFPNIRIAYASSGSGEGRASVTSNQSEFDFGVSNTIFKFSEVATAQQSGKAPMCSLLGSVAAIVMAYNVPEVMNSTAPLVIDRMSAAAIYNSSYGFLSAGAHEMIEKVECLSCVHFFSFSLLYWDDPRLKALNPSLATRLPHRRINLIYRSDKSGTTNIFLQALNSFDSTFPVPPQDLPKWPFTQSFLPCPKVAILNAADPLSPQGYACPAEGNREGAAQLTFHPYSIAYLGLPFLADSGLPYFAMKNKAGTVVLADDAAVESGLAFGVSRGSVPNPTIATETSPIGNLGYSVDAADSGAWPIIQLDFFMVPDVLHASCERALLIARFLIWVVSSSTSLKAFASLGYSSLPDELVAAILERITQLKCGSVGSTVPVFDSLFPDEVALRGLAVTLAVAFVAVGGLVIRFRDHPAIVLPGWRLLTYVALGCAANCLTVFAFTGYPSLVRD